MKQKLAKALYTKCFELMETGERNAKVYEIAFQDIIEEITGKIWWEVTDCDIFKVLLLERDAYTAVAEIINNLKEEYIND